MVTALANGPVADGAVSSENDGNDNSTRSDERQNDARIEDAVQMSKNPEDHGMKNTRNFTVLRF